MQQILSYGYIHLSKKMKDDYLNFPVYNYSTPHKTVDSMASSLEFRIAAQYLIKCKFN